MTDEERAHVDEACLRLMGYDPHWDADYGDWAVMIGGSRRHRCPSRDPSFIVPLAEVLHDRGFLVRMFQTTTEGKRWSVSIVGKDGFGFLVAEESGDSLPVCLAIAAARAMGTETER